MQGKRGRYVRELFYPLLFIAVTCFYFREVFTAGSVLAYEDGLTEFYPLGLITRQILLRGGFPFWNPYMFSGFPLMASMQLSILYPIRFIQFAFLPLNAGYNASVMFHLTIAGYFTFLYIRRITGGRIWASIGAGLVYGYLCYLRFNINHIPSMSTAAWFPLVMLLLDRLRERPCARRAAALAIAVAVMVLAGHPQTAFYAGMVAGAYVLAITVREVRAAGSRGLRTAAYSAAGVALAVVIAAPQLVSTRELSAHSWRPETTYEFFSQYPFPPSQLPTVLYPGFYNDSDGKYWGPLTDIHNPTGYMGTVATVVAGAALLCALFAAGMGGEASGRGCEGGSEESGEPGNEGYRPGDPSTRWYIVFWGAVFVGAVVLSFGSYTPIHRLMHHVPGYNLFRTAGNNWFEAGFALSVLCGIGIALLSDNDDMRVRRAMARAVKAVSVLGAAVAAAAYALRGRISGLHGFEDAERVLRPGAIDMVNPAINIPIILMAVVALLAWLSTRRRFSAFTVPAIVLLIAFEVFQYRASPSLWTDAARIGMFRSGMKIMDVLSTGDGAAEQAKSGPGRTAFFVMSTLQAQRRGVWVPPLTPATRGVQMLDGYDPLVLRDYAKLLDIGASGVTTRWRDLIYSNDILSMLNTRYIVVFDPDIKRRRFIDGEKEKYRRVFSEFGYSVYENLHALPRAYGARRVLAADDIGNVKDALYAGTLRPPAEAALSYSDIIRIGQSSFAQGEVHVVSYSANRVVLDADYPDGRGFVILADQYYPGWTAEVDGVRTEVFRSNGVLRGVVVPEGTHRIVFKYVPEYFRSSSAAAVLALVYCVFVLVFRGSGRKRVKA